MKITELMTKEVRSCRPEHSLEEAAGLMLKWDVGVLPVVDAEGRVLGMITDRDVCMCSLIEGRPLTDLPVSLAASAPAYTCGPADSLNDVCSVMQTHKIKRLPVVDGEDRLLGMLGLGDVVRATSDVTAEELRQVLTAVMEPRPLAALVEAT